MFQMNDVGRRIAQKRKEKNMTQMALADAMGVSFQAVSNWERGNSMPDISKLPELSAVLDISIDELLTDEKPAKLVKHILDGDAEAYIEAEGIEKETVAKVAPILEPKQTESLLNRMRESTKKIKDTVVPRWHINDLTSSVNELISDVKETVSGFEDMVSFAPFVSEDYLGDWVDQVSSIDDINDLAGLAPFLSEEKLDALVDKLDNQHVSIRQITSIAPFLSEKSLDKLASRSLAEGNLSDLHGLAPFLSEKALDDIVHKLVLDDSASMSQLVSLAPFLSDRTLDYLATNVLTGVTPSNIVALAPFLSTKTLDTIAEKAIDAGNLHELGQLAPFLSDKTLDRIVRRVCRTGDISVRQVMDFVPFLSEESLDWLAASALHKSSPEEIATLAPHLSHQALQRVAEGLISRYGIKGIKPIAPFL